LGFAAGFRPTLFIDMAPLVLWVAFSIRPAKAAVAGAVVAFCGAVAPWFAFLAASTGGFGPLYHLLTGYAYDQTRDTSFLMGARAGDAIHMATEALVWSCLGVLSWVWAIPSAARRDPSLLQSTRFNRFLAFWFLPAFALSAIFHVGDPDQTLAMVPATCLLGARVLSSFPAASLRGRAAIVSVAIFLNVFLFCKPISKLAKASTFTAVRSMDSYMQSLVDGVAGVRNSGGITAVFPPGVSGWRNLSYYLPAVRLIVADSDQGTGTVSVFRIQARRAEISAGTPAGISIPSCGVIALADPGTSPWEVPGAPAGLSRNRNLWLFPSAPGLSFPSHGIRFVADDSICGPVR
jgi:hypothetical protein